MSEKDGLSVYAVGDVQVNRDDPESIFSLAAPVLREANIAFCQLEIMYSEKGSPASQVGTHPARAHPRNVSALTFAGFNVVSMAGNHALDWGNEALLDTAHLLRQKDIQVVGAGKDIAEARRPVVIERKGTRVAFLAYNSILPQGFWADVNKPGCAPVRISTLYEAIEHGQPGTPCRILTFAKQEDLEAMVEDIQKAKLSADVVIVSLHWGLHFVPALLATYQKEVGHAAIDAGADLILGTHAHILKGIEVYKGRVITYSLGNFAFDIGPQWLESPWGKDFMKIYPNLKGARDPEYPTYAFPVDSRKTIVLKCTISNSKLERVAFLPALINRQGQPEILRREDRRSSEVFEYMQAMCQELGTKLFFQGDDVVIGSSAKGSEK